MTPDPFSGPIDAVIRVCSEKLSPRDIEERLGWKAKRKVSSPESRVFFSSHVDERGTIEEHLEELCSRLEEKSIEILSFAQDGEVEIWCSVFSDKEFVGFGIDAELIKRLAVLRVSLVFSCYEKD